MTLYLPIAEMAANIWLFLGMGAAVGFLSGMFGVGGGFLMTPLLIFIGVPPPVAVGIQQLAVCAAQHIRRQRLPQRIRLQQHRKPGHRALLQRRTGALLLRAHSLPSAYRDLRPDTDNRHRHRSGLQHGCCKVNASTR